MPRASFLTSISTINSTRSRSNGIRFRRGLAAGGRANELPRGIAMTAFGVPGAETTFDAPAAAAPIRGRNCASRSASTCRCSTKHSPRPRCRRYLPTSNSRGAGLAAEGAGAALPTTGRPCGTSGMKQNRRHQLARVAHSLPRSLPRQGEGGRRRPRSRRRIEVEHAARLQTLRTATTRCHTVRRQCLPMKHARERALLGTSARFKRTGGTVAVTTDNDQDPNAFDVVGYAPAPSPRTASHGN